MGGVVVMEWGGGGAGEGVGCIAYRYHDLCELKKISANTLVVN